MKIFTLLSLLIAGSLCMPYNDAYDNYLTNEREQYEISNFIDDSKPYATVKNNVNPSKSLPLEVYKEIVHLKPSELFSLSGILKAVIKPILKSAEFQIFTEFVDETMQTISRDDDVKTIVKQGINYLQEMYEMADEQLIRQILTIFLSQYSDETTARSITSMMGDFAPTLSQYLLKPLQSYYKSFVSPLFAKFYTEFENAVGEEEMRRMPKSNRWSDGVDFALKQIAKMTTNARETLQETTLFLQQQDQYL